MNVTEFGLACKKMNDEYKSLFSAIPVPSDYACTREQFLEALKMSVETKQPIETYLSKRVSHDDGRME